MRRLEDRQAAMRERQALEDCQVVWGRVETARKIARQIKAASKSVGRGHGWTIGTPYKPLPPLICAWCKESIPDPGEWGRRRYLREQVDRGTEVFCGRKCSRAWHGWKRDRDLYGSRKPVASKGQAVGE